MIRLRFKCLFLVSFFITGCSGIVISGEEKRVYHLIIGVGVVAVENIDDGKTLKVIKTNVIGAHASNQLGLHLGAGYSSSETLILPVNSNIILERKNNIIRTIKPDEEVE